MAKSIIGFHYAMGGNKQGIGQFMKKLNEAGIPFLVKGTDDAGVCFEAQEIGRSHGVDNWIIYRQSRIGPPDRLQDDVPDYLKSPAAAAEEHWQKVVGHWPQELDKSIVWLEPINEPRAKASPNDSQWHDMHPTDWLGRFMLEYARIANGEGYKVCGPSFNSGEPEVFSTNDYGLPGMVAYLKYCAKNPHRAALSVHEYVWRRWKDGEEWENWYPNLWGRVEAAMHAADANNIPRDFSIFVTEWGFAHNKAPRWPECEPFLTSYNKWAARWPQVKGVAAWTLQSGWGEVDNHIQSWIGPLTEYARSREFDAGDQPAQPHPALGAILSPVEHSNKQAEPAVVSGDWQAPSEPLIKGWIWVERVERKGELGRVHKNRLWLREEPNDVTGRKLGLVPIGAIVRITGAPQGDDPVYFPVEVSQAALESVDAAAPVSPQPDAAPEPPGAAGIAQPSDTDEGFDSPVGTPDERRGARVWPEPWLDANPYLKHYTFGEPERAAFHTGADLNLPGDADRDKPVYACAPGVVIYARLVPDSSWGNLVVIRHTMPDGSTVHSRYGHLRQIGVAKGEQVHRGRQIGTIGGADFGLANHLHFDISASGILESNPTHWPGSNQQAVRAHYVDPCQFIRDHRPAAPEQPAPAENALVQPIGTKQVIAADGLFLREGPEKTSDSKLLMDKGTEVEVLEEGAWDLIRLGDVVGYAFSRWLSPLMPAGERRQEMPIQPAERAGSGLGAPTVITVKHVIAPAGLKLREGRSTAFRELLTMPAGTAVEVLEEGEWDHVRVGGVTGYAFSQFLSAGPQVAAQPGSGTAATAAPVTAPGRYNGPKVDFVAGIHGPGDAFTWHDPGFRTMIEKLGMPVKFMSDGDRSTWYGQYRKPSLELVRVFWHPDPNRKKTAQEAWEEDMRDGVINFYTRGARHFEVHNEPRLPKEGMGSQWSNGAEFGDFLRQLMQIIKQNCPEAKLWYPGESPGVPWTNQFAFSRPAYQRVADLCYGLCQHAYSGNKGDVNTAANEIVGQVRKFHEGMQVWDKPIIVSECSVNRAASAEFRAKVYTQVSQQLRQIPGVKGVFWYISHWNAPENERANAESWYGTDLPERYKRSNP